MPDPNMSNMAAGDVDLCLCSMPSAWWVEEEHGSPGSALLLTTPTNSKFAGKMANVDAYIRKHNIRPFFQGKLEEIIVHQPADPLAFLRDSLARDESSRSKLLTPLPGGRRPREAEQPRGEGVSLKAHVSLRGRGAGEKEVLLEVSKQASGEMVRGARGAALLRSWADELAQRVRGGLLGGGGGQGQESEGGDEEAPGTTFTPHESEWRLDPALEKRLREATEHRLQEAFAAMDTNMDGTLGAEERDENREALTGMLLEFGMDPTVLDGLFKGSNLTFDAFRIAFLREWEATRKEEALAEACLTRAIASCVRGGSPDEPLRQLRTLSTDADVEAWCMGDVARSLVPVLKKHRDLLIERQSRADAGRARGGEQDNSKFGVTWAGPRMATFGVQQEFYGGIGSQIGLPHPRLLEGMEAEHCRRDNSKEGFTPGNYASGETTPEIEWKIANDEVSLRQKTDERRVRPTCDIMADPEVREAGLRREEVVALKLYTGPMFLLYNAVLRGFPGDTVAKLKGNKYTTTIYCIVSGIIKLSRIMKLPENRMVYRGLGGLELPKAFVRTDEFGVRGGVEFAMMSTTLDRSVAIQYAGRSVPTIFEIDLGAIDRGASLQFLSQYPKEEEILFPPRSYLEVVGTSRAEVCEDGTRVSVVRLKVNANVNSQTVEQIEDSRRQIFLSAGEHTLHEIEAFLKDELDSKEMEKVLDHRPFQKDSGEHVRLVEGIVSEMQDWLQKYRKHDATWYNDNENYAAATRLLMQLKGMAADKFRHWVEVGNPDVIRQNLWPVNRQVESQMIQRLDTLARRDSGKVSPEQAEAALLLCKRRGIVVHSVDELNHAGWPPMVAAATQGDTMHLRILLAAGGKVDQRSYPNERTALHWAAMMGYEQYVQGLLRAGASLWDTDRKGRTCLHHCAMSGHPAVCRTLCEEGGRRFVLAVDKDGKSCAHIAAENGHLEALKVLYEAGGQELLMIGERTDRITCAHKAADKGHNETLRWLCGAGGKELLDMKSGNGWPCAHFAASSGHVDTLRMLVDVMGRDAVMHTGKSGSTAISVALNSKHTKVCIFVAEIGGLELVQEEDKGGWTALHRMVYSGEEELAQKVATLCGERGVKLLGRARREVGDQVVRGTLLVHRGWPSAVSFSSEGGAVRVEFRRNFCTVRSRACCPVGGKAYYELEIVGTDTRAEAPPKVLGEDALPQFGFATRNFEAVKGYSGAEGVGNDAHSWGVDGARKRLWHAERGVAKYRRRQSSVGEDGGGEGKYQCQWRTGDVVGLACNLMVGGKIQVSVNGDFSPPSGAVFEINAEETGGLFAAFSGKAGAFVCNLGPTADGGGSKFKHAPPKDQYGGEYVPFAQLAQYEAGSGAGLNWSGTQRSTG